MNTSKNSARNGQNNNTSNNTRRKENISSNGNVSQRGGGASAAATAAATPNSPPPIAASVFSPNVAAEPFTPSFILQKQLRERDFTMMDGGGGNVGSSGPYRSNTNSSNNNTAGGGYRVPSPSSLGVALEGSYGYHQNNTNSTNANNGNNSSSLLHHASGRNSPQSLSNHHHYGHSSNNNRNSPSNFQQFTNHNRVSAGNNNNSNNGGAHRNNSITNNGNGNAMMMSPQPSSGGGALHEYDNGGVVVGGGGGGIANNAALLSHHNRFGSLDTMSDYFGTPSKGNTPSLHGRTGSFQAIETATLHLPPAGVVGVGGGLNNSPTPSMVGALGTSIGNMSTGSLGLMLNNNASLNNNGGGGGSPAGSGAVNLGGSLTPTSSHLHGNPSLSPVSFQHHHHPLHGGGYYQGPAAASSSVLLVATNSWSNGQHDTAEKAIRRVLWDATVNNSEFDVGLSAPLGIGHNNATLHQKVAHAAAGFQQQQQQTMNTSAQNNNNHAVGSSDENRALDGGNGNAPSSSAPPAPTRAVPGTVLPSHLKGAAGGGNKHSAAVTTSNAMLRAPITAHLSSTANPFYSSASGHQQSLPSAVAGAPIPSPASLFARMAAASFIYHSNLMGNNNNSGGATNATNALGNNNPHNNNSNGGGGGGGGGGNGHTPRAAMVAPMGLGGYAVTSDAAFPPSASINANPSPHSGGGGLGSNSQNNGLNVSQNAAEPTSPAPPTASDNNTNTTTTSAPAPSAAVSQAITSFMPLLTFVANTTASAASSDPASTASLPSPPYHRVQTIRYRGVTVWEKARRVDFLASLLEHAAASTYPAGSMQAQNMQAAAAAAAAARASSSSANNANSNTTNSGGGKNPTPPTHALLNANKGPWTQRFPEAPTALGGSTPPTLTPTNTPNLGPSGMPYGHSYLVDLFKASGQAVGVLPPQNSGASNNANNAAAAGLGSLSLTNSPFALQQRGSPLNGASCPPCSPPKGSAGSSPSLVRLVPPGTILTYAQKKLLAAAEPVTRPPTPQQPQQGGGEKVAGTAEEIAVVLPASPPLPSPPLLSPPATLATANQSFSNTVTPVMGLGTRAPTEIIPFTLQGSTAASTAPQAAATTTTPAVASVPVALPELSDLLRAKGSPPSRKEKASTPPPAPSTPAAPSTASNTVNQRANAWGINTPPPQPQQSSHASANNSLNASQQRPPPPSAIGSIDGGSDESSALMPSKPRNAWDRALPSNNTSNGAAVPSNRSGSGGGGAPTALLPDGNLGDGVASLPSSGKPTAPKVIVVNDPAQVAAMEAADREAQRLLRQQQQQQASSSSSTTGVAAIGGRSSPPMAVGGSPILSASTSPFPPSATATASSADLNSGAKPSYAQAVLTSSASNASASSAANSRIVSPHMAPNTNANNAPHQSGAVNNNSTTQSTSGAGLGASVDEEVPPHALPPTTTPSAQQPEKIAATPSPPPQQQKQPSFPPFLGTVRVASFNILFELYDDPKTQYYARERIPLIIKAIEGADADIVGLQEVTPFLFSQLRESGKRLREQYYWTVLPATINEGRDKNLFNQIILSRFPILDAAYLKLDRYKRCLFALLLNHTSPTAQSHPQDNIFIVANTHLKSDYGTNSGGNSAVRANELRNIFHMLSAPPPLMSPFAPAHHHVNGVGSREGGGGGGGAMNNAAAAAAAVFHHQPPPTIAGGGFAGAFGVAFNNSTTSNRSDSVGNHSNNPLYGSYGGQDGGPAAANSQLSAVAAPYRATAAPNAVPSSSSGGSGSGSGGNGNAPPRVGGPHAVGGIQAIGASSTSLPRSDGGGGGASGGNSPSAPKPIGFAAEATQSSSSVDTAAPPAPSGGRRVAGVPSSSSVDTASSPHVAHASAASPLHASSSSPALLACAATDTAAPSASSNHFLATTAMMSSCSSNTSAGVVGIGLLPTNTLRNNHDDDVGGGDVPSQSLGTALSLSLGSGSTAVGASPSAAVAVGGAASSSQGAGGSVMSVATAQPKQNYQVAAPTSSPTINAIAAAVGATSAPSAVSTSVDLATRVLNSQPPFESLALHKLPAILLGDFNQNEEETYQHICNGAWDTAFVDVHLATRDPADVRAGKTEPTYVAGCGNFLVCPIVPPLRCDRITVRSITPHSTHCEFELFGKNFKRQWVLSSANPSLDQSCVRDKKVFEQGEIIPTPAMILSAEQQEKAEEEERPALLAQPEDWCGDDDDAAKASAGPSKTSKRKLKKLLAKTTDVSNIAAASIPAGEGSVTQGTEATFTVEAYGSVPPPAPTAAAAGSYADGPASSVRSKSAEEGGSMLQANMLPSPMLRSQGGAGSDHHLSDFTFLDCAASSLPTNETTGFSNKADPQPHHVPSSITNRTTVTVSSPSLPYTPSDSHDDLRPSPIPSAAAPSATCTAAPTPHASRTPAFGPATVSTQLLFSSGGGGGVGKAGGGAIPSPYVASTPCTTANSSMAEMGLGVGGAYGAAPTAHPSPAVCPSKGDGALLLGTPSTLLSEKKPTVGGSQLGVVTSSGESNAKVGISSSAAVVRGGGHRSSFCIDSDDDDDGGVLRPSAASSAPQVGNGELRLLVDLYPSDHFGVVCNLEWPKEWRQRYEETLSRLTRGGSDK